MRQHGISHEALAGEIRTCLSIRDMQHAMRHADPRTTLRYDMAKANLDRHAARALASYLAGMSSG